MPAFLGDSQKIGSEQNQVRTCKLKCESGSGEAVNSA
jgi:hypothetical protein